MELMAQRWETGEVEVEIIEVRFAFAGKTARVNKRVGEAVNKYELLASLDRKPLQSDLDKQLAAYEQQRAEFEIFAKKNPNPGDDITMYMKKIQQAQLDSSVKAVEQAKARLDEADLTSPVNGIVVDDGGNRVGLFVTPASNAYKIMDLEAKRIWVTITPEEIQKMVPGKEVVVEIGEEKTPGKLGQVMPRGKEWAVEIKPASAEKLKLGVKVKVVGLE